ncbi:MAG: DUF1156 domain-containing protein, partial [Anaerolineaceae bacterium]
MTTRPAVLIEDWLPFEALGVDSQRERSSMTALPPTYYLHVWWARRPLSVSRAAILAGVLPQWSPDWPDHLQKHFPDEDAYHDWFVYLVGVRGDPVAGYKLVKWAKERGIKLKEHPYGGAPRAFSVSPSAEDLELMRDLLEYTWGERDISVMDVTAGGGSIPFEALRYGFTTYANELNSVASVVLKATLDYPARFGPSLTSDIRKWGDEWARRVEQRLAKYFPKQPNENIFAYLWARTVACPTTGKPVPLSPNWWLRKPKGQPEKNVAIQLIANPDWDIPQFVIKYGDSIDFDPSEGTVNRGVGRSPWTGEAIEGDYIKREAQEGRMGQMLFALATKESGGLNFRVPSHDELEAVRNAEIALSQYLPSWEAAGLVPSDPIPDGNKTDEPHRYGMFQWTDMFSPRQLLAMLTFLETLQELSGEIRTELSPDRAVAVETYLSLMLDKCPNYNSRLASWHAPRTVLRSVFDRHDFSFKWTFGEFDGASNMAPWAVDQVEKAYRELAELASPAQYALWQDESVPPFERLEIWQGSATDLEQVPNNSLHNITFDPPYEANVMYAELSDFFYVWLKRSVGHLFPEFFQDYLTNKDDEAVANEA